MESTRIPVCGAPAVALVLVVALASPGAGNAASTQDPGSEARIRPGDIVAANLASHVVSVYDGETGAYRGPAFEPGSGGLQSATGIAFGPDGDLYVGSAGNGRILRYDGATGDYVGVFASGGPLQQPFSLIFGPEGDLYVSSGPSVLRYAPDGRFAGYAARDSSLVQPIGLAFGPDGLLYVVNSTAPAIARFDPDSGTLVDVLVSDSLAFPSDVAFGPKGALYVSNAGASRVVRFDGRTGAFDAVVAALPDQGVPMGLAFRGSRLVIGDFGKGRLFFLDAAPTAGDPAHYGGATSVREVASVGLHGPENVAVRPGW